MKKKLHLGAQWPVILSETTTNSGIQLKKYVTFLSSPVFFGQCFPKNGDRSFTEEDL